MNVIITGGTKGIGKAIALRFAKAGFNIALCARTKADLRATKKELESINPTIIVIAEQVDLNTKTATQKFAKKILEKWNRVAVLVNNAATFLPGTILEESDGFLENMMMTNVYAPYYLTRALLPTFLKQGRGHIFNICSVASQKVYPNCSAYVISKYALFGFTKTLRQELMDKNIKVTAVLPGATLTNSWVGTDLPKGRIMPPEDIANAIWGAYNMSGSTTVEEIVMRPQLGDL